MAAAVITGEGNVAIEYVTWNGASPTPFGRARIPQELIANRMSASPDAGMVIGVRTDAAALDVWPIADISKARTIRSASRILSETWVPARTGSAQLAWVVGQRVELVRPETGDAIALHSGLRDLVSLSVRPDGSGVLVTDLDGRALVIEVDTRRASEVSTRVHGLPLARGLLLP